MALKKYLATLATKEALAKKMVGKRKRSAIAVEEKEFCRLRRGIVATKETQARIVEKVREIFPDLVTMMCPSLSAR